MSSALFGQISFASSVLYWSSSGFVYSLVPVPTAGGDGDGDGDGVHTQDCVRHVNGPQETRVNGAHSPDEGPDTHERPERTEESTQEESEEGRNRGIVYIAGGSSQLSSLQLQNLAETRNKYTHHRSRHARPSPHGSDPRFAGSHPGHRRRAATHREGKMMRQKLKGLNTELDIAYS